VVVTQCGCQLGGCQLAAAEVEPAADAPDPVDEPAPVDVPEPVDVSAFVELPLSAVDDVEPDDGPDGLAPVVDVPVALLDEEPRLSFL
jgi:hypothetical protein